MIALLVYGQQTTFDFMQDPALVKEAPAWTVARVREFMQCVRVGEPWRDQRDARNEAREQLEERKYGYPC